MVPIQTDLPSSAWASMQNCAEWRSLPKVVVDAVGSYCDGGAMMICDCEL